MASREALAAALVRLGFEVLPSAANFLFARHRERAGAELFEALRRDGVLVRHFKHPRIDRFLRITVGTEAQNARLIAALEAEQKEIADLLADGSLYAIDNARALKLATRSAQIDEALMTALERWEMLGSST
jgi:hypothetical protein